MINTLAIANYRSLRNIVMPLDQLTVITGANGSGKSNLYRALRLLSETAMGGAVSSLAREGGIESAIWAGPESFSRAAKAGHQAVQGGPRNNPVNIKLGFAGDDLSYSVEFGLPAPYQGAFAHDPEIKREAVWHGGNPRHSTTLADRKKSLVRVRDDDGQWRTLTQHLAPYDSILTEVADPRSAPEVLLLREQVRSWRFYDSFRTDRQAPARMSQIGTRTPALYHDGRDLAAALQTIIEIGDRDTLDQSVEDAFPGAKLYVEVDQGRFTIAFQQHGLLRPLSQAELSDGTLRYLLLMAALLTPRPPELIVLNEPETSLHPDLVPALARLILKASLNSQTWVVSHSEQLTQLLNDHPACQLIRLNRELGETHIEGQNLINTPGWHWPTR